MKYWLLKTEPDVYSFDQLLKEKSCAWDGIRNHQAKNFLKQAAVGDRAFIYHTGDERQVVGLAEVTRTAYPDPDPEMPGDWVKINLKPLEKAPHPVPLAEMKLNPKFADFLLIKQSRLSVVPVQGSHLKALLSAGGFRA